MKSAMLAPALRGADGAEAAGDAVGVCSKQRLDACQVVVLRDQRVLRQIGRRDERDLSQQRLACSSRR